MSTIDIPYINKPKQNLIVNLEKPKIILQEGRKFLVIKQSKYSNDEKNIGVVIRNKDYGINLTVTNNINDQLNKNQLGGNNDFYYQKYLKYKSKYLELKNKLNKN
jgi:hypothetical protein